VEKPEFRRRATQPKLGNTRCRGGNSILNLLFFKPRGVSKRRFVIAGDFRSTYHPLPYRAGYCLVFFVRELKTSKLPSLFAINFR
jgi:hypothetical protein